MINFLGKKLLKSNNSSNDERLRGLWITDVDIYPAFHGNGAYVKNITSALSEESDIDLVHYTFEEKLNKNLDRYEKHFKNYFPIAKAKPGIRIDFTDGIQDHRSIINTDLINFIAKQVLIIKYDYVVCDYVYLAPILDFIPNNIIKIINTHDIYGDRHIHLNWDETLKRQCFCISEKSEDMLFQKADIIITISDDENEKIKNRLYSKRKKVNTIKYLPKKIDIENSSLSNGNKLNIGFLGSDNPINISGLEEYLNYLQLIYNESNTFNLNFNIAGLISGRLSGDYPFLNRLGVLPESDIANFYKSIDLVINPMPLNTTGLKIKTIEALISDLPILGTKDAFTGLYAFSKFHTVDSIEKLARLTVEISSNIGLVNEIRKDGLKLKNMFLNSTNNEIIDLIHNIKNEISFKSNSKNITPTDIQEITKKGIISTAEVKDLFIKHTEKLQTRINNQTQRIINLEKKIINNECSTKPQYKGHIAISKSFGIHKDYWAQDRVNLEFKSLDNINEIEIFIINPNHNKGSFVVNLNDVIYTFNTDIKNDVFNLKCDIYANTVNKLEIKSSISISTPGDKRKLSYILKNVHFNKITSAA